MDELFTLTLASIGNLLTGIYEMPLQASLLLIAPMLLMVEWPYYLIILTGATKYILRRAFALPPARLYQPQVSCLILCYAEGEDVKKSLHTLCEQLYPGKMEIIAIIDGAIQNRHTTHAVKQFIRTYGKSYPNRRLLLVPKWQRGGRVSSLNAGLAVSNGDIIMALDGDTSFDNDMVSHAVRHFADPAVCAVSGALMVRNKNASFITRLQSIEYCLSLLLAKVGLSEFNILNNVSGAFGVFRRNILQAAGGWNTGSAEDLDLTLRMKQYFRRNKLKIVFEPLAVGHTDVPSTWRMFLLQRLRWDGDLIYIYLRKHQHSFNPRLIGWPNFLTLLLGGLFFQIITPFIIIIYLVWLIITMPLATFLAINFVIYLYYLTTSIILFGYYLIISARHPGKDLFNILLLPFFSIFMFIVRLWSCVAILNELWRRGHEESSMAPWWVLKRTTKH